MDVSIRADDVIDLDTAFDGDSFLASSAGAAAFLNLSGLTINDMDQDRYHDDDDELNDELGIQPRFLDPRFGPNGGKKGKDWRRESVALFKRLNEGNVDVSFDLLSSEMNEMFENPLLVDEEEPRSTLRPLTPHRAVAPHREPEVAPTAISEDAARTPTKIRQTFIGLHPLDPPQPSTPKTPRYATYFDQDTPQHAVQQNCTPTTSKRLTPQHQRSPLHVRTSPINVSPAPGTPTHQPIDDEEDVIFFGPPTAKERQASAKVHSMLGGEAAATPKTGTPRRSYQRGEVHTPTSARYRTFSVGSKTAVKASGSLWLSEELGKKKKKEEEEEEEEEDLPTPKPPVFTSLAMLGGSPQRRTSNTLTASPTSTSPTSASRVSFTTRREALDSGSQTSPTNPPLLARRNTTDNSDPSITDLSASPPGGKRQYSSETIAAAMEFMIQRTPTKPALVRHSSDLSPTPTLTATTPTINNGSPTQRDHNEKFAAIMQFANQVLSSPGRPRSFSYAPRDPLNFDLVPGVLASKSKARSNSIAAVPSPAITCNPFMLSPPIDVPFAAVIPLPDSAANTPDNRIDPPSLLRRSSETVTAAMNMLERRGSSPKAALMEHVRMEERAKALAAKEGESPMLIDLETPVRDEERRGTLRRMDEQGARTGGEIGVVEKGGDAMMGMPARRKVSVTQNQSRREVMDFVTAASDKGNVRKSDGGDAKVQVQAEKEAGMGTPSRLRKPSRTKSQFVMDLMAKNDAKRESIEEKGAEIGTPARLRKPSGSQQQLRSIPTSYPAKTNPTQTSTRFPLSSSGTFGLNFPSSHRNGVTTSFNARAAEDPSLLPANTTTTSLRRYNFDQPRDKEVNMAIDSPVRETSALRRYPGERSTGVHTLRPSAIARTDNLAARERDGDTAMLDDAATGTPSSTRVSARLASRRNSARQEDTAVTPRLANGKLPSWGVTSSTKLDRGGLYSRNRMSAGTAVPKRKFQERNDLMDEDQNNGREKMIQKDVAGTAVGTGGGAEVRTRLPVNRKPNLRLDEKLVTKLTLPRRSGIATSSSIPVTTTSTSRLKQPTRIGTNIRNEAPPLRPPAARTIARPSSRLAAPGSYTSRKG